MLYFQFQMKHTEIGNICKHTELKFCNFLSTKLKLLYNAEITMLGDVTALELVITSGRNYIFKVNNSRVFPCYLMSCDL